MNKFIITVLFLTSTQGFSMIIDNVDDITVIKDCSCSYFIHKSCLNKWLKESKKCLICDKEIETILTYLKKYHRNTTSNENNFNEEDQFIMDDEEYSESDDDICDFLKYICYNILRILFYLFIIVLIYFFLISFFP